ncbi:hypothetical protein EHYA_02384 [Embleya hyalina]|uniref:Uncharacterized protein n=1 Tax=Embleya hyalina TaxID=516124 RepID=A0A401YJC9_9ACTN|nr:hypothetical protein EHYA_02384 [Embleya hyalina]
MLGWGVAVGWSLSHGGAGGLAGAGVDACWCPSGQGWAARQDRALGAGRVAAEWVAVGCCCWAGPESRRSGSLARGARCRGMGPSGMGGGWLAGGGCRGRGGLRGRLGGSGWPGSWVRRCFLLGAPRRLARDRFFFPPLRSSKKKRPLARGRAPLRFAPGHPTQVLRLRRSPRCARRSRGWPGAWALTRLGVGGSEVSESGVGPGSVAASRRCGRSVAALLGCWRARVGSVRCLLSAAWCAGSGHEHAYQVGCIVPGPDAGLGCRFDAEVGGVRMGEVG